MFPEYLKPCIELLREEYVLVQAWKKTAAYIRYHNWYSDTLALDRAAISLPAFIGELRERLQAPESWQNDDLRVVLAPKSQNWIVEKGKWKPVKNENPAKRRRPLAHVSLADQVLATAIMLCLADRVETQQGDPRDSVCELKKRKQIVSYGNRLFCERVDNKLRHRWGSKKLYRAYFQDYREFISRPEFVIKSISGEARKHVYVIHADLRQFYDSVKPELLWSSIYRTREKDDDQTFYSLIESVFDWGWHANDENDIEDYANQVNLRDFKRVALPQGLVASGFFANTVLLNFDELLKSAINSEISDGVILMDACRYVDDFRIVVDSTANVWFSPVQINETVSDWLEKILTRAAPGVSLSSEKTLIVAPEANERPLIKNGARMNRIQTTVSGGFDVQTGEVILDTIQSLVRPQQITHENGWRLSPVSDVHDNTIARFGAMRYRSTFRSIRPMLHDHTFDHAPDHSLDDALDDAEIDINDARLRPTRTRFELDNDVKVFALELVEKWVRDPSNVRLLRVGLDLWPDVNLLQEVISLLRPLIESQNSDKSLKQIAWYCISEILRAGATETGLVEDPHSLPYEIDVNSYRNQLCEEARSLVDLPLHTIPWYLRQQALLFLATCDPSAVNADRLVTEPENSHYLDLIQFLLGKMNPIRDAEFATLAVLARRSFTGRLTKLKLNRSRKRHIALRDPSFILEISDSEMTETFFDDLPMYIRKDLCRIQTHAVNGYETLSNLILNNHPQHSLRNELSLLYFSKAFLNQHKDAKTKGSEVITPNDVIVKLGKDQKIAEIKDLRIVRRRVKPPKSMYEMPLWCNRSNYWRFQLGFLLRFILSGHPDFTRPVYQASWKEKVAYRPAESHWYQRLYGLYNAQPAFGDDWVPITNWIEEFLLALLRWPGCRLSENFEWVEGCVDSAIEKIEDRIKVLESMRGDSTRTLILPLPLKPPTATNQRNSIRACVVQTAVPSVEEIKPNDLELNKPKIRRKHRDHLSATLEAVKQMLDLRKTHMQDAESLDWLILPELAVHPVDVKTHLVPFARAYKTIILTGLTYEKIFESKPLVNSALWVMPEWSKAYGLQIKTRRQGKENLAPNELDFNNGEVSILQGFRACQWLIGFPWSNSSDDRYAWLTASVCYDATDLKLVSDLSNQSDVFAIPSLNKDVRTFDQMALALHYHMFQCVIVANSGQFGGSNAYWPRSEPHIRQIFHTHGQPQASVSFLEIDDIGEFLQRHRVSDTNDRKIWKHPPAGLNKTSTEDS